MICNLSKLNYLNSTINIVVKVIRIWDLGGEQRFKVLLPSFAKGADGGIFVFDITRYTSVRNIDDWLSIFEKNVREEIPIILVGVLTDGKNKQQVSAEEANEIAKRNNLAMYLEISTSTGENVEIYLFLYNVNK